MDPYADTSGVIAASVEVLGEFEPEHLRCPHCGYAVYGLTANRCPECGREFDWEHVRAAAHGIRADLFEHHWYDHPLPSLLRSWRLAAFHPRRLWACYSEHDPPRVGPLLFFVLIQGLVFAFGWHGVAQVVDTVMNWLAQVVGATAARRLRFVYFFRPGTAFLWNVATWHLTTFFALHLFYESKRRHGVRAGHILRVYAHCTALAALLPALWCVLEACIDVTHFFGPPQVVLDQRAYRWLGQAMFAIGVIATWRCLWVGYRRYLGMPHGWAIAAVSMFIGYLMIDIIDVARLWLRF